jgi:preprotein translocase subunit SecF
MEFFKPGKLYDFMGMRRFWIALSLFLTHRSIHLLFYPGPNYGTDFRGGTEIEVAFTAADGRGRDPRGRRDERQFSEPDVVRSSRGGDPSRFLIRVQEISTVDDATKEAAQEGALPRRRGPRRTTRTCPAARARPRSSSAPAATRSTRATTRSPISSDQARRSSVGRT